MSIKEQINELWYIHPIENSSVEINELQLYTAKHG